MEAIPNDLAGAARAARDGLTRLSQEAAAARTPGHGSATAAMSGAARAAIFADALLAAIHARLQEVKTVAK